MTRRGLAPLSALLPETGGAADDLDDWLDREDIPDGVPYLISPDLECDIDLNRYFLRPALAGASRNTQLAAARDIRRFLDFLWCARGSLGWRDATEADHDAYWYWRRQDHGGGSRQAPRCPAGPGRRTARGFVTAAAQAPPPDASPRPAGEEDHVLCGRPLRPGTSLSSTSRFGDDRWDLTPAQLQRHATAQSLNFGNVPERYRADAKDLFRLLLNGPHPPGVAEMSVDTIRQKHSALTAFWRWLDDRTQGNGRRWPRWPDATLRTTTGTPSPRPGAGPSAPAASPRSASCGSTAARSATASDSTRPTWTTGPSRMPAGAARTAPAGSLSP